jgi:serine/threonine-protein kinase
MKAVAKKPGDRFQSGAEMASALNSAVAGQEAAAAVPPPPRRPAPTQVLAPTREPQPEGKRSPLVLILAGIAAVLVLLLGVLLVLAFRASNGGRTAVLPTTPAIVWKTPTPDGGGAIPTATQSLTATSVAETEETPPETAETPEDTALPSTDISEPPTDTPEPPTDTSEPPTHTPPPTPTFTPTPTMPPPTPSCSFPAQGTFSGLWQNYRVQLGCPLYQSPQLINDAEQAFDNGHMFWRQDNDYAYVVYEQGGLNGTYQAYTDMWHEGDPDYSCSASPPPGKVQPIRGFGAVWCHLGGPSAAIGWGLGEEAGFWPGNADPMVQDFERGFIFRDSDGTTRGMAYVFFSDSGTFVRVHY